MNYCNEKTIPLGREFRPYYLKDTATGAEKTDTVFEFSYDDAFLYFHFIVNEKEFCPKYTEYNAPLYEGDIVELMLTLSNRWRYLEVEVNSLGTEYCVLIDNLDGDRDFRITKIPSVIKSTVKVFEDKWDCMIIISMEELRKLGWDPADFYFNAHREDYDSKGNMEIRSLSAAYSDNFHTTKAFVKVEFN